MRHPKLRTFAVLSSAAALAIGAVACEVDDTNGTDDTTVETPDPAEGEDGPDFEEGEPDPDPVEEDADLDEDDGLDEDNDDG